MFISSSIKISVAYQFCNARSKQGGHEPILWYFIFDPQLPCVHVNYVSKSNCPGEEEFLFSAYSVFTVEKCVWKRNPSWQDPHEIFLKVAPDNSQESNDLPTAPWC